MDNWLSKVLTDISIRHKISNEKARLLFEKILAIIFQKEASQNSTKLLSEENENGNSRTN